MDRLILLITLICLSCAFCKFPKDPVIESWVDEGILVQVRMIDDEESLDRLGVFADRWDVQPIRITIDNQTMQSYKITEESIDMPLLSLGAITKKLMRDALPLSITLKVASLFFWPLMIPSSIDGFMFLKRYDTLSRRLFAQLLHEEVIPPYTKVHRLVFVPKASLKELFHVTLQEQEELQELHFCVAWKESLFATLLPPLLENYYATHAFSS